MSVLAVDPENPTAVKRNSKVKVKEIMDENIRIGKGEKHVYC